VLVSPSETHRESFLAAAVELAVDEDEDVDVTDATFAALLQRFADYREGRNLPAGHVAATELWLVEGSEYIGRVSIRHELTENLRKIGGHIGYAVRPSRRRQGHGVRLLQLALPHARALGIDPALVTCDSTNIGSRTIIERCGGMLDSETSQGPELPTKLRYWLPTSS